MIHAMNDIRRSAFVLMRKYNTGRCYFERDVLGRQLALELERLGWLKRFPGRSGRPTTITLTDFGVWVLSGVTGVE
jgi:hypothetical protein